MFWFFCLLSVSGFITHHVGSYFPGQWIIILFVCLFLPKTLVQSMLYTGHSGNSLTIEMLWEGDLDAKINK